MKKIKKWISLVLITLLFGCALVDTRAPGQSGETTPGELTHITPAVSKAVTAGGFDNYITVQGDKLMDGDKEFRFISFNVPNLRVVEDPNWHRVTEFEQRDALQTIRQVGGTAIRLYTFTVKGGHWNGNGYSHYYGPNQYGEDLFKDYDRLLALANEYQIRVIIPLIDEWYWVGGRKEFAALNGGGDFYTDPLVKSRFKEFVTYILNRTNTITGVQYKDDKAILAFETGNELQDVPDAWTKEIADHVRSHTTSHRILVVDGNSYVRYQSVNSDYIDIISPHYYKHNGVDYPQRARDDIAQCKGKKPIIIGEFGCNETRYLKDMIDVVINEGASGALIWSLRFHSSTGGFYWHDDQGYKAYHWPGFDTNSVSDEINMMRIMREKAHQIRGLALPPMPLPTKPEIIPFNSPSAISWKGAVGARTYDLERSEDQGRSWTVVGRDIRDCDEWFKPFNDASAQGGKSYAWRIRGKNESGYGPYSEVYGDIIDENNIALGKPVTVSSTEAEFGNTKEKINDGNSLSRWSSAYQDNQWAVIDLQKKYSLDKVVITWEAAFASIYSIEVSQTGLENDFTPVYTDTGGNGGIDTINLTPVIARYVRLFCTKRATQWGNSVYELALYGKEDQGGDNQAPVVNAGADKTSSNAAVTISGTVSDDGRPGGALTIGWTKVSGPGTVTFSSSTSAQTTVTFSLEGTYTLRLTAGDGELSASDEVVVVYRTVINDNPIGKIIWIKAAANSKYISTRTGETNSPLRASENTPGTGEKYEVVDAGSGYIALKSLANGKYVSCWVGEAGKLQARADRIAGWEQFEWIKGTQPGTFSLKALANGKYVSSWLPDNNSMQAAADRIDTWEQFSFGE